MSMHKNEEKDEHELELTGKPAKADFYATKESLKNFHDAVNVEKQRTNKKKYVIAEELLNEISDRVKGNGQ